LLFVKCFISYAIPDTPHWVAAEMAKIEHRRREIEKQVSFGSGSFGSNMNSSFESCGSSMDTMDRAMQTDVKSRGSGNGNDSGPAANNR
jgi:hypothetical protein